MKTITRTILLGQERMNVSDALFGSAFPFRIEPVIYHLTEAMTDSYRGGYWDMFMLSNGGFYMSPGTPTYWEIRCPNQYSGRLSSDALGIVSCLCAYSHLSFSISEQYARKCAEHFHLLRHYAIEHAESGVIFRAID